MLRRINAFAPLRTFVCWALAIVQLCHGELHTAMVLVSVGFMLRSPMAREIWGDEVDDTPAR